MSHPLVSVILPTHNRARWVGRAIESVLAQTHRSIELIVVDDGSTDTTPEVLERFHGRIEVLRQSRAGAYAARNLALAHADGDFVAFIDSDDAWHPDRLASQLPLMERPETGLVFGDAAHVLPSGARGPRLSCFATTPPRRGRVASHFTWGNFVPTVTVLARRSCIEATGGFPTSHDVSADYLTWLRIAAHHELDYVDRILADYTVHEDGISYDLGHSLKARIELFSEELARETDPDTRAILERLVFNLGLHLGLAAMRGRARSVRRPAGVVRGALGTATSRRAAAWTGAFVARQARRRVGRPA